MQGGRESLQHLWTIAVQPGGIKINPNIIEIKPLSKKHKKVY